MTSSSSLGAGIRVCTFVCQESRLHLDLSWMYFQYSRANWSLGRLSCLIPKKCPFWSCFLFLKRCAHSMSSLRALVLLTKCDRHFLSFGAVLGIWPANIAWPLSFTQGTRVPRHIFFLFQNVVWDEEIKILFVFLLRLESGLYLDGCQVCDFGYNCILWTRSLWEYEWDKAYWVSLFSKISNFRCSACVSTSRMKPWKASFFWKFSFSRLNVLWFTVEVRYSALGLHTICLMKMGGPNLAVFPRPAIFNAEL